jgi:hypothetical protein
MQPMGRRFVGWAGVCVVLLGASACAEKSTAKSDDDSAETDASSPKKRKKKKAAASASVSTAASAAPAPSALPAPTALPAPGVPAAPAPSRAPTLATLFDGPPAVPGVKELSFGRAKLSVPPGWDSAGGWDSVDVVERSDKSAKLVLLRLDISEAYLDMNVATWVKVPFATRELTWEPRSAGKVGPDHLDAKLSHTTGSFGSDPGEFWQIATGFDGKKYALVVVAGVKSNADPKAREELVAAVQSVRLR